LRPRPVAAHIITLLLALTPGTRLGPYEVAAQIGVGGMGEVYRATDSNLKRSVAIKVLPASVSGDADRLARFQREAEVLAALNHPNIAAIYELERTPDFTALVMELVEGEDLSERIARGAIPIDEALPIVMQIAEALEAAHEQGIIHRDLKPANIKLRPDGTVKVLDFGLAKALEPMSAPSPNITASPTITTPAMMTGIGVILGTAAYMSPEQAKGRPADKRADIWALGCVLYEMVTGRRAFSGEDVAETLAHILTKEPDWTALPASTPTPIRRLLRRCVEKDRKRRLADAADARLEMDEALASSGDAGSAGLPMQVAAWARPLPWALVGALGAGLALAFVLWAPWRQTAPLRVTRATITFSGPTALTLNGNGRDFALSPDGTHLVYVGNNGTQLFVRALDALEPVAIASVGGAGIRYPFVSSDGQWVGFYNVNTFSLEKVAITGGAPTTIAKVDGAVRGATWAADDSITFATLNGDTGLQRVSARGGSIDVLTRPDREHGEADHLWPEFLPGGRAVLFTITSQTGGLDTATVVVRDLRTGAQTILVRGGSDAHYVPSGHLVYIAAGALRAIPFDLNRLETHGSAVSMLPLLSTTVAGAGDLAVANDGTLVYVDLPGGVTVNARTLVWVDRTGKEEAIGAPPRAYNQPRLSPDGTRVAVWSNDQTSDIWIWDLERKTLTPLTLDPGEDQHPLWTHDGQRIIFTSNRGGVRNLWWQAADGNGEAERLTKNNEAGYPNGITPDGTAVVFHENMGTRGRDLLQLALDETRRVTPLLATTFDEREGVVSPDGRWLAYESNMAGSTEIFVRPFPNVSDGQLRVSTAGGTRAMWARSGKELFYIGGDGSLLQVSVEAKGATLNFRAPIKLFEQRYFVGGNSGRTYDVSPDGQRFLMIKGPGTETSTASPTLILVQHWDTELKRLVPTK
jgi:eukaryotic-like serine/threonine-protein kinase